MNLIDHLHNNSKLEITVYDLNVIDDEKELISGDTRFDYTLTIHLKNDDVVYKDSGDWICDMLSEYDGKHYESNREELILDLKFYLIEHILILKK